MVVSGTETGGTPVPTPIEVVEARPEILGEDAHGENVGSRLFDDAFTQAVESPKQRPIRYTQRRVPPKGKPPSVCVLRSRAERHSSSTTPTGSQWN